MWVIPSDPGLEERTKFTELLECYPGEACSAHAVETQLVYLC